VVDLPERSCVVCQKSFKPRIKTHIKCSKECQRASAVAYGRAYYRANRGSFLEKQKKYVDTWKENNPGKYYYSTEYRLYYGARDRCLKSGLDFSITVEDIVVPDKCPILGIEMVRGTRHSPSLDRKDSSKGYTPDNIWVISKVANRMKNDATPSELRVFGLWAIKQ